MTASNRPYRGPVSKSIVQMIQLEHRDRLTMSRSDRLADWITAFSGSMVFAGLHIIWFGTWIAVNLGWLGFRRFDPFPFGLLTMVVSLEAIFLSTFVLISQNRQAIQADRRAKIDLQVDVIAEQEVSKLIQLMVAVANKLGVEHSMDADILRMEEITDITALMDEIDEGERQLDPEGAKGPDSAADTEA
jgi:uncharacterized membrane protein